MFLFNLHTSGFINIQLFIYAIHSFWLFIFFIYYMPTIFSSLFWVLSALPLISNLLLCFLSDKGRLFRDSNQTWHIIAYHVAISLGTSLHIKASLHIKVPLHIRQPSRMKWVPKAWNIIRDSACTHCWVLYSNTLLYNHYKYSEELG